MDLGLIVAPEVAGSIPVGHPKFFLVFQGLKTSPGAGFFRFGPQCTNFCFNQYWGLSEVG